MGKMKPFRVLVTLQVILGSIIKSCTSEQVALKLEVSPSSVELSAGGEEVVGGQEAGLFQDRLVTAHVRRV